MIDLQVKNLGFLNVRRRSRNASITPVPSRSKLAGSGTGGEDNAVVTTGASRPSRQVEHSSPGHDATTGLGKGKCGSQTYERNGCKISGPGEVFLRGQR